jgi:hypothetical protein
MTSRSSLIRCTLVAVVSLSPLKAAAQGDAPLPSLTDGRALIQQAEFAGAEAVFRARTEADASEGVAWFFLGYSLHAQGKLEEAVAAHETAAGFAQLTARAGYNAACAHARLGHVDEGIAWLVKIVGAGYGDRNQLDTDQDLDPLRADPRFATLIPPLLEGSAAFEERPRILHEFIGEAAGDQYGWVARAVGDLDGDGAMDFATTAPTYAEGGPPMGRVYVYSSRTGETLHVFTGQPGWSLGNSVAGRVDVDADGVPDVLAGGPGGGPLAGVALVYSGATGEVLHTLTAGEVGDQFGIKMCGLEDLDGDGHAEVAVGAWTSGKHGANAGRVVVFSGASGEELFEIPGVTAGERFGSAIDATREGGHHLLAVGASSGGTLGKGVCRVYRCTSEGAELAFSIEAEPQGRNLGMYFVTFLGDVDDDGVPDVYASDWNHGGKGPSTGRVYVHSGATGEQLLVIDGHVAGEGFGTSSSECGDVNGDGHADLVVGAWQNAEGGRSAGKCYLHSGADGSLLATWTSLQSGDTLGFDSVGLGDVDGDGHADYLFTSAWSLIQSPKQGRVWLVAGQALQESEAGGK